MYNFCTNSSIKEFRDKDTPNKHIREITIRDELLRH